MVICALVTSSGHGPEEADSIGMCLLGSVLVMFLSRRIGKDLSNRTMFVNPLGRSVNPSVNPLGRSVNPSVNPLGRSVNPSVNPLGKQVYDPQSLQ